MLKITTFAEPIGGAYTCDMTVFVKATKAPKIRGDATKKISLLYAVLLVVMLVSQLFTFETFLSLFASFNLPLHSGFVSALPALIVAAELFALPFLLGMYLSPAFRWVSMISGWFVAALWAFLSLWVVSTRQAPETMGFLGTLVDLMPGAWAIFVSVALGIAAAWASWGMWPGVRYAKPNTKK